MFAKFHPRWDIGNYQKRVLNTEAVVSRYSTIYSSSIVHSIELANVLEERLSRSPFLAHYQVSMQLGREQRRI